MRNPSSPRIVQPACLTLALALASCSPAAPDEAAVPPTKPEPSEATSPAPAQQEDLDHEAGWQAILAALQSGDLEAIKARTTAAGYELLIERADDEDPLVAFKRWGGGWADWEIRWQSNTDTAAMGNLGPETKEHGIWLVKDGPIWKLDRWAPGK